MPLRKPVHPQTLRALARGFNEAAALPLRKHMLFQLQLAGITSFNEAAALPLRKLSTETHAP